MDVENNFCVQVSKEDEKPIFKRKQIKYKPDGEITNLAVSSGHIVIIINHQRIIRFRLTNPTSQTIINYTTDFSVLIKNIFLHPNGYHLLIISNRGNLDYLHFDSDIIAPLLENININYVTWMIFDKLMNKDYTYFENNAHALLSITDVDKEETIKEIHIKPVKNKKHTSKYTYIIDKVYNFSNEAVICGMVFSNFNNTTFTIIFAMDTVLCQFFGSMLNNSFPYSKSAFNEDSKKMIKLFELDNPTGKHLYVYHNHYAEPFKYFVWITELEIHVYELQKSGSFEKRLWRTQNEGDDENSNVILTKYHIFRQNEYKLRVENVHTYQIVYRDFPLSNVDPYIGIYRDSISNIIWVYTTTCIFKYSVLDEQRDLWRFYLHEFKYDKAIELCENDENIDTINYQRASSLFDDKAYEKSAKLFATVKIDFSAIALRFLQLENQHYLLVYLEEKFCYNNTDNQSIVLFLWIVELYLSELDALIRNNFEENTISEKIIEFHKFYEKTTFKVWIDEYKDKVYNLFKSHGNTDELLYFANLIGNSDMVVNYYIHREYYRRAFEILKKPENVNLMYDYCEQIVLHKFEILTEYWKSLNDTLDVDRILGALCYILEKNVQLPVLCEFVEYCVKILASTNVTLNNMLILIYCKIGSKELMVYLKCEENNSKFRYDPHTALQYCKEYKQDVAIMHLLSLLNIYEEAVDVALKTDIELAKTYATKAEGYALRKKLWIKIILYVLDTTLKSEKDSDKAVSKVIMVLNESSGIVQINDVIQYLPDFLTIDNLKNSIIDSLQQYNSSIELINKDISSLNINCNKVKKMIEKSQKRSYTISPDKKCSSCDCELLDINEFYLFSCSHIFHTDCLYDEIKKYGSENINHKLFELRLSFLKTKEEIQRKKFRIQIDEILCQECVYCGNIIIELVDKPFAEFHFLNPINE